MDAGKAHLTELELQAYYASQKKRWDAIAEKETAMKEAEKEAEKREQKGVLQGISLVAKNMLKEGLDISLVQKTTGLNMEEIRKLQS